MSTSTPMSWIASGYILSLGSALLLTAYPSYAQTAPATPSASAPAAATTQSPPTTPSAPAAPSVAPPATTTLPVAPVAPTTTTAPPLAPTTLTLPLAPPRPPAPPPAVPTPAQQPMVAPTMLAAPPPPPPPSASEKAPESKWYEKLDILAIVDGYGAYNYRTPKPQGQTQAVPTGGTAARAWDANNGFSLAWLGLDASIPASPVGATLSLRYGPYTSQYAGVDATASMQNVKQAYATYRPGGETGKFYIDFGKFDTIIGAETTNSWENQNYTRGVLYTLAQPLFHVGAKATYEASKQLALVLMAVNGWNINVDNNVGKSFGAQIRYALTDDIKASLTYFGGPEQADYKTIPYNGSTVRIDLGGNNKRFRNLVDFVLTANATKQLSFVANADYGTERVLDSADLKTTEDLKWYGAMLGARFAFNDTFAAAVRGELYYDPQGYTVNSFSVDAATARATNYQIQTGTLTLEAIPASNLIIRFENRYDHSNQSMFPSNVRGQDTNQYTTTLGVVVKSR